jgi:photosystem II stability/assembly factor-like uncharacterized protein
VLPPLAHLKLETVERLERAGLTVLACVRLPEWAFADDGAIVDVRERMARSARLVPLERAAQSAAARHVPSRIADDFRHGCRSNGWNPRPEVTRMPKSVLLVATRKGLFVFESEDRRDWNVRGPFCEGWPVYHAVHDAESGAIYAAAASEWHGSAVWRSPDLGETWEHSSEGLTYGEDGLELTKVSNLAAAHGRVLVGTDNVGIFESRDGGASWSLLSTLDGQPGRNRWNDPANQPPGHLGLSAILPDRSDPQRFWAIVQGVGIFETTDDGASWTPRNEGLRADWPREDPEVGFCVHKLVRSPVDGDRFFQQNHCGMHRSDDGGRSWTEITEGLPTDFGFAAAAHPHDRDSFYVIPLDPGHARCMPDGQAAVWRTRDAGSSWQRLDRGLPQHDAHLGVLREGLAIDAYDTPGLYFGTSTGQVFASDDEGESWREIASYLPAISSVEVATVE